MYKHCHYYSTRYISENYVSFYSEKGENYSKDLMPTTSQEHR